ncbi:MAG: AmmeMemoRadiSam system protein B [bacterium]
MQNRESIYGLSHKVNGSLLIALSLIIISGLIFNCGKNKKEDEIVSEDVKEELVIRYPKYAGSFYSDDPVELKSMIENFFSLADVKADDDVKGIEVPHAGYIYSGLTTAFAFKSVGYKPDVVIIIGPSHRVPVSGAVLYPEGVWRTPFGDSKVDVKLTEALTKASDYFHIDSSPHEMEHCIEVQLPFIQYLWGDASIVPIVVWRGDEESARQIGEAFVKVVSEDGRKILIVATADLSHYHSQETAKKLDDNAISALTSGDPMEIIRSDEVGASEVDCPFALASVGYYAQKMGAKRTEVLKWTTSAETTGDTSQVVGYLAMKWTK